MSNGLNLTTRLSAYYQSDSINSVTDNTLQDTFDGFSIWNIGTTLSNESWSASLYVKNIGNENAVNSVLSDSVPANTTYVPDSTTLNGTPVADVTTGVSPLQGGLTINAPEDTTARVMNADPTGTIPSSVATVTRPMTEEYSCIGCNA